MAGAVAWVCEAPFLRLGLFYVRFSYARAGLQKKYVTALQKNEPFSQKYRLTL